MPPASLLTPADEVEAAPVSRRAMDKNLWRLEGSAWLLGPYQRKPSGPAVDDRANRPDTRLHPISTPHRHRPFATREPSTQDVRNASLQSLGSAAWVLLRIASRERCLLDHMI